MTLRIAHISAKTGGIHSWSIVDSAYCILAS